MSYEENKLMNLADGRLLLKALDTRKGTLIEETLTDQSIASFTDGASGMPVKTLTVEIEPVQDLHGQDAPYPPGGGKNLIGLNTSPVSAITYVACSATEHTNEKVTLVSTTEYTYARMTLSYQLQAGTYTFSLKATYLLFINNKNR